MKKKYIWFAVAVIACAAAWVALSYWAKTTRTFDGREAVWMHVPHDITEEALQDTLKARLGNSYGKDVFETWQIIKGNPSKAPGAYLVNPGDRAIDVARRLRAGIQTPVKVTFNNMRLFDEMAQKMGESFEFSPREFTEACNELLPQMGYNKNNYIAAFLPDSYEFYWNAKPRSVVQRLAGYTDSFWTPERKEKAAALGLTPQQVTVLASIVEEESAQKDEYPVIARLYLNRLQKGMKLQADPTVKYAVGNFALRRILLRHLETQSPYNTYVHTGLPPGPIRMPEKGTIDAVLNAPQNDYLYMCAKEDFSGRHNFATTLQQHNINAARYRSALDARGIR